MFEPSCAETDLEALRQTIKTLHSQLDAAGGRFLFGSKNQSYTELKRSLDALRKLADRAAGKQGDELAELGAQIVQAQQALAECCRAYLAEQAAAGPAEGKNAARVQAAQAVAAAAEEWLRPQPAADAEPAAEEAPDAEDEIPATEEVPQDASDNEATERSEEEPAEAPPAPADEETSDEETAALTAQERSRLRLGQFAFRRSAGRSQDGAEAALAVVAWSRLERVLDRAREAVLPAEAAAAAREAMSGVAKKDAALLPLLPEADTAVTFCQVKEFLLQASDHALEEEDNLTKPLPKKRSPRKTNKKKTAAETE